MKYPLPTAFCLAVLLTGAVQTIAADAPAPKSSDPFKDLFPDETVAKGKEFEVKRSEVDEAWTAYKVNATARGQQVRETQAMMEQALIDRILLVKIMMARASDADRAKGRERADKVLSDVKANNSPQTLERQFKSLGTSAEKFWQQLLDRAVCEEVMEREVRGDVKIPAEAAKKFYDENLKRFTQPERVRASHILFSTRDNQAGAELPAVRRQEIRAGAEKILARAKAGEDFVKLVRDFSDDAASKAKDGELIFARSQMVPEFEAAAFSLQPGQISDLVTTQFGYHIIKVSERLPEKVLPFAEVESKIKDGLSLMEVEKLMPSYFERIKKEAQVEYLNGAGPK